MRRIRKSALAESDLVEIWLYSYRQWGDARADRYFDEIDTAINRLSENPEPGKRCDHVRKGYWAFPISQHVVYYTATASACHVIRVLHGQMDPDRHL